jgi:hypothetical protein
VAFDNALKYAFVPADVEIRAGVGTADPGPPAMLWFDDVTVCSEP